MRVDVLVFLVCVYAACVSQGEVLNLVETSFHNTLDNIEFVLVNFFASWCRFSRDLSPIYDSTSDAVAREFTSGNVALAKVDCDDQGQLCASHGVSKYPTLRLFKFGRRFRSEYRGQRSVEAFVAYLHEQTANPITNLSVQNGLDGLTTERSIVGTFPALDKVDFVYNTFFKLAHLITDCKFYAIEDKTANASTVKYVYKKTTGAGAQVQETAAPANAMMGSASEALDKLRSWAGGLCTPLVRQLTFENAEEITEPRLPLLILFYRPTDDGSASSDVQLFTSLMEAHFTDYKDKIVPLVADGNVFSHPLMHMGKSVADLPLLAIDSFAHMFVYPGDIHEALTNPVHIRQFLSDLASERLHRRFHGMPDPEPEAPTIQEHPPSSQQREVEQEVTESDIETASTPKHKPTAKSVFKLLRPSSNRYSIVKDEL